MASSPDLCEWLDEREAGSEMVIERSVLFMRDSSNKQEVTDHQVEEGRVLCAA